MSSVTQTYGANIAFIEELYEKYRANPDNPRPAAGIWPAGTLRSPLQYINKQPQSGKWSMLVPIARHNGFCNVGFVDGHVRAMRPSTFWFDDRARWDQRPNLWRP